MSMALGVPVPLSPQKIVEVQALGLKVVVADSEGSPQVGIALAKTLIDQYKVALIIGDLSSEVSLSVGQICQQQGVPLLSLARHPLLADLGPYIFMFNPSYSQQMAFLVDHAITTQKFKKFGILFPRHNYGISMAKAFYEAAIKKGGEITSLVAYDAHETTFTQTVKNLVGLYCTTQPCDAQTLQPKVEFEALFIPEFTKLAYVVPALVQADILVTDSPGAIKAYALATKVENPRAVQLLGLNSWNDASTLQKLGNQANGAFFVDVVSFEDEPALIKFKQDWEAQALGAPTPMEVLAHDAMALATRILAQKSKSREDILAAIAGFSGRAALLKHMSFSPEGELLVPSIGFSLMNGRARAAINK